MHISAHLISLVGRVFASGLGDWGSIPGRVIPKTLKMVLDATLLDTQHYKVRIKSKVEQSREWSTRPPLHLGVVAIEKGAFGSPSTTVANFTYLQQVTSSTWTVMVTHCKLACTKILQNFWLTLVFIITKHVYEIKKVIFIEIELPYGNYLIDSDIKLVLSIIIHKELNITF